MAISAIMSLNEVDGSSLKSIVTEIIKNNRHIVTLTGGGKVDQGGDYHIGKGGYSDGGPISYTNLPDRIW